MVCDNCHDGTFPVGSIYVLDGKGSKKCVQCGTIVTRTFDFTQKPFLGVEGQVKEESDPVSHPSHYTQGGIETISFIQAKLTKDEFVGYCIGNVLKYTTRYKHKNGVEDLNKAKVYLQWAIERMSEDGEQS